MTENYKATGGFLVPTEVTAPIYWAIAHPIEQEAWEKANRMAADYCQDGQVLAALAFYELRDSLPTYEKGR